MCWTDGPHSKLTQSYCPTGPLTGLQLSPAQCILTKTQLCSLPVPFIQVYYYYNYINQYGVYKHKWRMTMNRKNCFYKNLSLEILNRGVTKEIYWTKRSQVIKTQQEPALRLPDEWPTAHFTLKKLKEKTQMMNYGWSMQEKLLLHQFSSLQSLSRVRLFATPWIAARQASLSITNFRSSLKLTSIELVMPSSHLILCRPLLLLPPIPPSTRVFSSESTLHMRWPKDWSFSFSIMPSKEHPGIDK